MGIFRSSPEELAAYEKEQRDEDQRNIDDEFWRSPVGQARAAWDAGAKLFQTALELSSTEGHVVAMQGAYATTDTKDHTSALDSIEAEGWWLEHAAYVYRVTGSVSRDKFLSSGQQEAVHGEIVGIYIFRRRPETKESA